MAETKIEKFLYPVVVGASILGVVLALRKPAAPTIVQNTGGINLPPLSPLIDEMTAPAGNGGGTNVTNVYNALADPVNANPNSDPNVNTDVSYLRYNQPPRSDIQKADAQYSLAPAPSSGCGCSGSGSSPCNTRRSGPQFADGAGSCLSGRSKMSDAALSRMTDIANGFFGVFPVNEVWNSNENLIAE